MSTVLYLIRHSEGCSKSVIKNIQNSDSFQENNEKSILSVVGEEKARRLSELDELKNIDAVYSSNYVRCLSTAKYIAEANDIVINIDERLGERIIGDIDGIDWYDFHQQQIYQLDRLQSLLQLFAILTLYKPKKDIELLLI